MSASMAIRVARFAGVNIEDVLDGTYPPVKCCHHCGHPIEVEDVDGDLVGEETPPTGGGLKIVR